MDHEDKYENDDYNYGKLRQKPSKIFQNVQVTLKLMKMEELPVHLTLSKMEQHTLVNGLMR